MRRGIEKNRKDKKDDKTPGRGNDGMTQLASAFGKVSMLDLVSIPPSPPLMMRPEVQEKLH